MSVETTILMGAIAGNTVFLGLPVARLRVLSRSVQGLLNAVATGILVFLLWDVITNADAPVQEALGRAGVGAGAALDLFAIVGVFAAGMGIGLLAIVYLNRWLAGGDRAAARLSRFGGVLAPERWLAMTIAVGLGMHNFSEGLAIGQAAATGAVSFAAVLIVGFAVHNATEGFGIAAPIMSGPSRMSWSFMLVAGAIAGLPTMLGTIVGYHVVNPYVYVLALALAAGTLLYVISEMLHVGRKLNTPAVLGWGLLIGFLAGYGTDLLMTAAGA